MTLGKWDCWNGGKFSSHCCQCAPQQSVTKPNRPYKGAKWFHIDLNAQGHKECWAVHENLLFIIQSRDYITGVRRNGLDGQRARHKLIAGIVYSGDKSSVYLADWLNFFETPPQPKGSRLKAVTEKRLSILRYILKQNEIKGLQP